MFMFLLFGRAACFFLLFGRGTGVHSLTGLPGSSLSDPTTKKDRTAKKKNGFRVSKSIGAVRPVRLEMYRIGKKICSPYARDSRGPKTKP